jgi:DNA-binding transcriptional LysR family regulator
MKNRHVGPMNGPPTPRGTERLAALDLNLLLALSVLLEEGSVTAAARRLGLTQSAVSHKLARLREQLGDELLVRGARGTEPTLRARALRQPLAEAIDALERALGQGPSFDPARARRSFVVASTGYCEFVTLPPIMRLLRREAPGVELIIRQLSSQPERLVSAGEVDLAIATLTDDAPGVIRRKLFSDRFVCLVREGHPDLRRGALDLPAYLRLPHALVAPRGHRRGRVDTALERKGLRRQVVLFVPDFFAVARVIAETDLVLTIPARIAQALQSMLSLRLVPPPLDLPPFDTHLAWHERHQHDPAHLWLRRTVGSLRGATE